MPAPVREKLGIKQGDAVVFEIEDDVVTVRRATALDMAYRSSLASTLSEWESGNDERAYREL
ncbi:MAG: AbrB/MazE/SpoVT family DNA-binding domain-containing protein [Gammaproteobacteria bacterium]